MEWWWGDTDIENRTPKNFLRILASCYKVLDDFIKVKNPEVISFSGMSKGHNSVYFGNTFQKRLKTLFGEKYDITYDESCVMKVVIFIFQEIIHFVQTLNDQNKINDQNNYELCKNLIKKFASSLFSYYFSRTEVAKPRKNNYATPSG